MEVTCHERCPQDVHNAALYSLNELRTPCGLEGTLHAFRNGKAATPFSLVGRMGLHATLISAVPSACVL